MPEKIIIDKRTRPGPGIEITSYGGPIEIVDDPSDVELPPNRFVSIDRARFERVRQSLAELVLYAETMIYEGHDNACAVKIRNRTRDLQPGDLDELP